MKSLRFLFSNFYLTKKKEIKQSEGIIDFPEAAQSGIYLLTDAMSRLK
jgi:hypothetical protein